MEKPYIKQKIVVAMSGGVDSSVVAALLKKGIACFELGRRDVIGIFMKFWPRYYSKAEHGVKSQNRCCSSEAEKRARRVAKILGIPFYVFNFEKEFKKRVVDYFLKEQKTGRTPNPCVVCNKEIKFGLLVEKALELGADYVATGHYAKIKNQKANIKNTNKKSKIIYKLLKAKDKNKDQSYFLWKLNQKQLSKVLFPIGNYTRKEVEDLAQKFKLPFSGVKKSFEVCFIPETTNEFLEKYLKNNPGNIVDKNGKKIGRHKGLHFYTIGQRKGIEVRQGPYYVVGKNLKKNILIVSKNEKDLRGNELIVKNVNWISGKEPKLPAEVFVKIRYRADFARAVINSKGLKFKVYGLRFKTPQRAITPGQSAVFYKGEELIGGGIIQ